MKVSVTAIWVQDGLNGIWRGGRKWPAKEAVTVEVVGGDDPTVEENLIVDGRQQGKKRVPDPAKISDGVLKALKDDRRFVVVEQ